MNIVVDTSAIIAVVTNEPHKQRLVEITRGVDLLAPPSLHWEIGNAFTAMIKRRRIRLDQALAALRAYAQIPILFSEVALQTALELAERLDVYAYDGYVIGCALQHRCATRFTGSRFAPGGQARWSHSYRGRTMTVYSLAEAKEHLDALLEQACTEGEVQIKRQDGRVFVIKPMASAPSPLDVQGVDLGLSRDEIVTFVREVRQR